MFKAHFGILDQKRKEILPLLKKFKSRFYLAGGTGLALQFGHRDSIDFDFFTDQEFNSQDLHREVKRIFEDYEVEVIQAGNMTLNLIVNKEIRMSFFCIKDRLLYPLIDIDYFNVASIKDIACMKMAALLRAEFKDYVDLYYLLKQIPLDELMSDCRKKYKGFEEMVYLKALVSLHDIDIPKILFKRGYKISADKIRKDLEKKIKEYLGKGQGF